VGHPNLRLGDGEKECCGDDGTVAVIDCTGCVR
jgi:hypothetical protein